MNNMIHYKEKMRYLNDTIEKYIYEPIRTTQPILYEIVKYALDGGKRLRSVITLTVAEAVNPDLNLDKLALCVELLHNASLIVDDMPCMDNDKTRRGKPSTHIKFGEASAVLAGSSLLTLAFEIITDKNYLLKPNLKNEIIRSLANLANNTHISRRTTGFSMLDQEEEDDLQAAIYASLQTNNEESNNDDNSDD